MQGELWHKTSANEEGEDKGLVGHGTGGGRVRVHGLDYLWRVRWCTPENGGKSAHNYSIWDRGLSEEQGEEETHAAAACDNNGLGGTCHDGCERDASGGEERRVEFMKCSKRGR